MQLYIFWAYACHSTFYHRYICKEYISLSDKGLSDQEYHCTIQFHDVKEYEEITINRLLQ